MGVLIEQERWEYAWQHWWRKEKGRNNDPTDEGGETIHGIAKNFNPDFDFENATPATVKEYLFREVWLRYRINEIENADVARKALEIYGWMGADDGGPYLQRAICAAAGAPVLKLDGIVGSKTLATLSLVDQGMVLVALRALAIEHVHRELERRPEKEHNRRGWVRRACE